jgi:lipopolysaccharide transport system permease protein
LLLLLIYSFVFTVVLPGVHPPELEPFALFMFCGILPWTWFSSSLMESSNVLVAGGNLIKKVLFPAEVLPIVSVLAGLVHFCLGLPILAAFLIYYGVPVTPSDLLWFPVIVAIQLLLTLGLALIVSSLTVHFRDVRDLLQNVLTLWFFATPIIYPISQVPPRVRQFLNLNPFTHLAVAYQEVLFRPGPFTQFNRLLAVGVMSILMFVFGYFIFDRLRDTFAEEV